MKIEVWSATDKGLRRDSNQDSFLTHLDLGLFIVADGMGGHSGGEVASSLAVETCKDIISSPGADRRSPREILQKAYEEASHRIFDKAANESPELAGMGTTMVMAYVRKNYLYIANVGDSRCYLFRKPYLWQVTEDHSLINEQIRAGVLTEDTAASLVGRNVITRSVGYEREVNPDIFEREIIAGETFVLCSDGLSSLVEDEKIAEILNKTPIGDVAQACVQKALSNGGDDNVTVIVLHFSREG